MDSAWNNVYPRDDLLDELCYSAGTCTAYKLERSSDAIGA